MDDRNISKMTDDEINEIAVLFFEAKKAGDNNRKKYYWAELFKIVIGNSELNRKLKSIIQAEKGLRNDADTIICDFFNDRLKYYDPEKNSSFDSFMCMFIKQYIYRIKMKTVFDDSLEEMTETDDGLINERELGKIVSVEPFAEKDRSLERRSRLPSLIIQFYKHLPSKQATVPRFRYFRIFNTENIAMDIFESRNIDFFNKKEAYDSTDRDYIEFINYSKYEKLDDLLRLRLKRLSEVIDDYPDKEAKIIFPINEKVIAEYIFRSGDDGKRPTVQNVSDFKKKYQAYCRAFWDAAE